MTARDPRLDNTLSRTLTCSTALAAAVCLVGLALSHLARSPSAPAWNTFRPDHSLNATRVLRDACQLNPLALTQLGVLLLILTPAARVAITLLLFLRQRDRTYALLSALVLAALASGLLGLIP